MALFLQSQSSSCCNTPSPPANTPTAEGVLYLPLEQVAPGACDDFPMFQLTYPQVGTTNGGITYASIAGYPTTFNIYIKVRVRTVDGCYDVSTYLNPNNRTALAADGFGIKVRYPTSKPYIVDVWAQVCGPCACIVQPINNAEWYCKFAKSESGNPQYIFGDGSPNNPYNITYHPGVTNAINYAFNANGGGGVYEPKFKYMGNNPFGVNVLP